MPSNDKKQLNWKEWLPCEIAAFGRMLKGLDELHMANELGWPASNGDFIGFQKGTYDSNPVTCQLACFHSKRERPLRWAVIEAYSRNGGTQIVFRDGHCEIWNHPRVRPIGESFKEFAAYVVEKAEKLTIGWATDNEEPSATLANSTDGDVTAGKIIRSKFGRFRDLTADEVRNIVRRCRAYQKLGGKVPDFVLGSGTLNNQ